MPDEYTRSRAPSDQKQTSIEDRLCALRKEYEERLECQDGGESGVEAELAYMQAFMSIVFDKECGERYGVVRSSAKCASFSILPLQADRASSAESGGEEEEEEEEDADTSSRTSLAAPSVDEQLSGLLARLKKLAKTKSQANKQHAIKASLILGDLFQRRNFVQRSNAKAFKYYENASRLGSAEAVFKCGEFFEKGIGCSKDYDRAVIFYKKGASMGHLHAMHRYGLVLLKGDLRQPVNLKEGVTWLKRAASVATKEFPDPLYNVALCYEKDGCSAVVPDEGYSLSLLKKGTDFGHWPSQYRLGLSYEFGRLGCAVSYEDAIRCYKSSAEGGYPLSQLALSSWYLTGHESLLEQSDAMAYYWARRAAEAHLPKAQYAVGHYCEKGIGTDVDLGEAKRWYKLAAENGNKNAIQILQALRKKEDKEKKFKTNGCVIL